MGGRASWAVLTAAIPGAKPIDTRPLTFDDDRHLRLRTVLLCWTVLLTRLPRAAPFSNKTRRVQRSNGENNDPGQPKQATPPSVTLGVSLERLLWRTTRKVPVLKNEAVLTVGISTGGFDQSIRAEFSIHRANYAFAFFSEFE